MNRNFYIHPTSDLLAWNNKMEEIFNAQHKDLSKLQRKEAFHQFCQEKDLKDRCVYWRLFCKAIFNRENRLPTKMECEFNNIFKPDVENRPDLHHLLLPKEDDPLIFVTTAEDWAEEDNFLYDIEKMGYSDDEYYDFLGDRNSTYETREEFLLKVLS